MPKLKVEIRGDNKRQIIFATMVFDPEEPGKEPLKPLLATMNMRIAKDCPKAFKQFVDACGDIAITAMREVGYQFGEFKRQEVAPLGEADDTVLEHDSEENEWRR